MDELDSLARPLGVTGEAGPIELPAPDRAPIAGRTQWAALAAFAILGAAGILVLSAVGDAPVADLHMAWSSDNPDAGTRDAPDPVKPKIYALQVDDLPSAGPDNALATLVVVTNYQCVTCKLAQPMLASLRSIYGSKLRIVFKPHVVDSAREGAIGACAAHQLGEHDRFDTAMWRVDPTWADSRQEVTRVARELQLDAGRYAAAVERCESIVAASTREVANLGIGPRSYFVNGRLVDPWGSDEIGTFQTLIDEEIVKARRRIAAGTTQARYYREWVLDIGEAAR